MAWNEPGNKNPWGNNNNNNDQGPPDLDEVLKSIQQKLNGFFGGGSGGSDGGSAVFAGIILIVLAAVWAVSGFYIVEEGKRAIVTRFGAHQETTMPGLHWHIPWPIERREVIDVSNVKSIEVGYQGSRGSTTIKESLMLTQDENIVAVKLAVQYRIKEGFPEHYLFNLSDPEGTIKAVAESALREVVGKETMDFILKEGREAVAIEVRDIIQQVLNNYKAGIDIKSANLQDAQPPGPVQAAFADAIKAREDKQRFINEAQAYRNEVLPKARGESARLREEAEAYKQQVIAKADGEASRFDALLTEYQAAPEVTRKRLYIDTMESVLSGSKKVIVDVEGGNNLMYLPLDKLGASTSNILSRAVNDYQPTFQSSSPSNSAVSESSRISDERSRSNRGSR